MVAYRIEYGTRAQAKCQRKELCEGVKIGKGELRFGTYVKMSINGDERGGFKWRHWYCMTPAVIKNLSESLDGAVEELDGFEELRAEDQEKVRTAIAEGQIDPADIPATANQPKGEDEAGEEGATSKKRKRAPAKKTAKAADGDGENVDREAKPKAKRVYKKKPKVVEEPIEAGSD
ncbi:hypothetical protein CROQUDRAFT_673142 [Cronartium quercuum f. sp. fusiforme G11]|uniref:PARP-type domain-containing protein n=1 Tax=Cronartium quercuum f. sp. fusiforme G11 TaxID=708437 RepID=A0A9P6NGB9_9BASI|nr:hypothetical protein CROQUDRAFT_673142 [Cronartium quercuum f. sp. fusiforme G11]